MKWILDSMLMYWIILLAFSLGTSAIIYAVWLKDVLV